MSWGYTANRAQGPRQPSVWTSIRGTGQHRLGDCALLVPPTDESRIADALLPLHRDEALRRRLIERGLQRARTFTSTHYAKGMFEIMDEVEPVIQTWR